MTYRLRYTKQAYEEAEALPSGGRSDLAEVLAEVRVAPWRGMRYAADHPAQFRTWLLGRGGLVVYLIRESSREVMILEVVWTG